MQRLRLFSLLGGVALLGAMAGVPTAQITPRSSTSSMLPASSLLPAIGSYTPPAILSTDGTTDPSIAVGVTPTATQPLQNDPVLDVASATTRSTRPAVGRLSEHPDLAEPPGGEDGPIP